MIKLSAIIIKSRDITYLAKYPSCMYFDSFESICSYEIYLKKKWSDIFGVDISALLVHRERPDRIVGVIDVYLETARQMRLPKNNMIFAKTKQTDITKARKYATMICDDLDFTNSEIENGTPLRDKVGYYYLSKLKAQFAKDEQIRMEYENIKDRVIKAIYLTNN